MALQSVLFGIMLYLTPSVLLLALLMCREQFDSDFDERLAAGH
jgi:EamA domain-containing membrane protein RarD